MPRPLPSLDDARRILADKRTRPQHRAPPSAARPLAPFLKALDERFGKGADGLKARWREVVGEVMAQRTEPVKLTQPRGGGPGVLELKVDGPGAALIQHQAPEILARVNLFMGEGAVAKLRIVQGVVRRPVATQNAAAARRRRLPPLDAAVEAGLEAGLSGVIDEPLKAALRKLGREVLRREA
jgi:hypothetical protein